jgi:hypothetical protein
MTGRKQHTLIAVLGVATSYSATQPFVPLRASLSSSTTTSERQVTGHES